MKFAVCGASVVGPGHLDLGAPNQDSLVVGGCRGGWIAAVADGLGSRRLSGHGSRGACRAARRVLREAPAESDPGAAIPKIHAGWLQELGALSSQEAATTLIFARATAQGEVMAAQLGDGLLLARCGGLLRRLTPERSSFGDLTWALEENCAPERWILLRDRLSQPGDGVILATDGVADDLRPEDLGGFMDAVYATIRARSRRRAKLWLQDRLEHWPTPLHGDDKTLAAIFRISP
ncbi:PP2C family serine/threonine-protein phosphatase [Neomegalonema perideroedes]|uniref:PP2C family serine/threonine-protein phosphatase n=1 Tax=Neomegalonema perideroedes TaxID=217219 RepID=UPI00037C640C|nr:PP2C family serine/threonine-protein phosphatase [Neomegalonema perideroedes]